MARTRRGGSVQVSFEMDEIETGMRNYERRALDIPYQICLYFKPRVERDAKLNAEWTDRTGNARQGLRGEAVSISDGAAALLLIHGMWYGIHLEFVAQGRYGIINPTMESVYAPILDMMRNSVR